MCAQRADLEPRRRDGSVATPLLSQAGATNFQFGGTPPGFWTSPRFRDFGFWIHA